MIAQRPGLLLAGLDVVNEPFVEREQPRLHQLPVQPLLDRRPARRRELSRALGLSG